MVEISLLSLSIPASSLGQLQLPLEVDDPPRGTVALARCGVGLKLDIIGQIHLERRSCSRAHQRTHHGYDPGTHRTVDHLVQRFLSIYTSRV